MKLTPKNILTLMPPEGLAERSFPDDALPGHYLRVRDTGSRSFTVQYEHGGKTRRMTLGTPAILTLSQSRVAARDVLAKVRLGRDPASEKAEAHRRAADTFGSKLKVYLESKATGTKPRTFEGIERDLLVHAAPLHPLALERPDLRRLIAARLIEIAAGAGPGAANNVRANVSAYCAWLVGAGLLESNPCLHIVKAEQCGARDHVILFEAPAGEMTELGKIWNAASAIGGEQSAILQLLMMLLLRRCEIGDLRWSEVELEKAQIVLPWWRTKQKLKAKRKYDFVVPLPPLAVEVLRAQPRRFNADGRPRDLIFGAGDNGKGWQNWGGLKSDLDARIQPPIRPWRLHDFRRCGSTAMHELGMAPPHIIEAILQHSIPGIAGVYCRAEYLVPRCQAITQWCNFILELAEGKQPSVASNVMTFPARAS